MRVQVLHVADCPGTASLLAELARLCTDRDDVCIDEQVVHDASEAARLGMTGSPTILIDGTDPFPPSADAPTGLTCRLYRSPTGAVTNTPDSAHLRAVLARQAEAGNPGVGDA